MEFHLSEVVAGEHVSTPTGNGKGEVKMDIGRFAECSRGVTQVSLFDKAKAGEFSQMYMYNV